MEIPQLLVYLGSHFVYVPETGQILRKTKKGLKEAGCLSMTNPRSKIAYRYINISRKNYLTHRLVFLLETKRWPKGEIDHIDGNTLNNAFTNLREVSSAENHKNRRKQTNNTSGCNGVSWDTERCLWVSQIQVSGKNIHLGRFRTIEQAYAKRLLAEQQYGFSPTHGKR
jgi:hypothetical protein